MIKNKGDGVKIKISNIVFLFLLILQSSNARKKDYFDYINLFQSL